MGTFTIGQKIKTGRMSRNMTQADLAKALGVSPSAVGMWEQDRREPDLDTFEALADVFNVPMSYFVTDEENHEGNGKYTKKDYDRLEALHQNPRLGLLFDRVKDLDEEDIQFMEKYANAIIKERDGN